MSKPLVVCYFGITDPNMTRTRVHIRALRAHGIEVLECFDATRGWAKFANLFRMHRRLKGRYDVLVVSAASGIAVPLARLITRTPVVFDAGWSLYEGVVISRGKYKRNPIGRAYVWVIDCIAATCADLVLLETDAQIAFFNKLFKTPREKCRRVFTGVDESRFRFSEIQKHPVFTVLFRGKWMAEAGIECAIEAARMMEKENIRLYIMSPGYVPEQALPQNVTVDPNFYPWDELCKKILECYASLGQLASHERLQRTIPHKAFESIILHMPYITARAIGISELLTDNHDCLMIQPGSSRDLAQKIRQLARNPELRRKLSANAARTFEKKCSESAIGAELSAVLRGLATRS